MLTPEPVPAPLRPARRLRPERLLARQTLGASLAKARGFWGLTQEQVGLVAGVSKATVGKWERGTAEDGEPDALDLYFLALFFGTPMESLCTGRDLAFNPSAPASQKKEPTQP